MIVVQGDCFLVVLTTGQGGSIAAQVNICAIMHRRGHESVPRLCKSQSFRPKRGLLTALAVPIPDNDNGCLHLILARQQEPQEGHVSIFASYFNA